MIFYHSWVFVIVIVTGECTVLLLWICGFKVCTLLLVLIILFESLYPFKLHYSTTTNNNTIFFVITNVTGKLTMLVLPNYGSKVCVISFGFYSTQYKVYIHLTCNNIQQHTAEPWYNLDVWWYLDDMRWVMSNGSAVCCCVLMQGRWI